MIVNGYEWQSELKSRYPDMLSQIHSFEHGEGWKNILESLFSKVQRFEAIVLFDKETDTEDWRLEEPNALPYTKIMFVQIKEKFGGIRIYHEGGDHKFIHDLIREAEKLADITCESCGTTDFVKKQNNRGWIYTSCESCKKSPRSNP